MKSLFAWGVLGGLVVAAAAYADIQVNGSAGAGSGNASAATGNLSGEATSTTGAPETPSTPDDTTAAASCVPACYNTPDAKPGCDVSNQCKAFDASHPNYFKNIDKTCQLPAGTAIKMAQIESSCRPNVRNKFGYTGMFQFDTNSCKRGNLYSLSVQAACMCDYTANTKRQFMKQNGGRQPSAGMYYLFHQQGGGCATKLAFGGNQRAADVIQQCAKVSARTALKRVACNLPSGCGNKAVAAAMSAQDFANLYLSKFNGIDNTNVCAGGSLPDIGSDATAGMPNIIQNAAASNPFLAQFIQAAGGNNLLAQLIAGSGSLTADGRPLNILDVLRILGMEDTSSVYDPVSNSDYPDEDEDDDTVTLTVENQADGSKKVTVEREGTVRDFTVPLGSSMWACDGSYSVVRTGSAQHKALDDRTGCRIVTEGTAEDALTED